MSKIITSDNGVELEVCSLGIAVVDHEEQTETWARLSDAQRVELAAALDPGQRGLHVRLDNQAATLATYCRERDEALRKKGEAFDRAVRAERERDAAVARAEQMEKKLAKVMSDYQDVEDERDEWKARAEAAEADNADAKIDGDPAVHVVRESDLPAARVDGDYYVAASAKGDYKWPQHGPSWWAGRAQDALAEAARYTSLARLAADREATVDPVEDKARVEADRRYSGEPNHAFIEGAVWAARHLNEQEAGDE